MTQPQRTINPDFQQPARSHAQVSDTSSIAALLRQLGKEVPVLFTKELALAKAELSESIRATKVGVGSIASGGAVVLAGFIILLQAAVYGLSILLQPWLAALIIGGAVMLIGVVMLQAGKKKLEPSAFTPDRTLHALQKDQDTIRGHDL